MKHGLFLVLLLVFLYTYYSLNEQKKQTSIYMNALIQCMNGKGFYDKANKVIHICEPVYSFTFEE